jgi:aryl-alcohol dehydrogenase-like predicted oxidoreductase
MSDDVNDRGLSRKHIMESCEQSLRRLRTDYVDLYQCHRYDPETPLDEVVAAMSDLVRQGKVLYWGVSCWEPEQLEAACASAERQHGVAPISNQPPYNMLQREIEAEVVPTSARLGIGQVVYSPLAQGLLTGKYLGGAVPEGSRLANDRINKFMKDRVTEANLAKVEALGAIAAELELSLPTLALAWCLREPNVASVIMGATRPEQVAENAAAGDVELEAPVLERIDAILGEGA